MCTSHGGRGSVAPRDSRVLRSSTQDGVMGLYVCTVAYRHHGEGGGRYGRVADPRPYRVEDGSGKQVHG